MTSIGGSVEREEHLVEIFMGGGYNVFRYRRAARQSLLQTSANPFEYQAETIRRCAPTTNA